MISLRVVTSVSLMPWTLLLSLVFPVGWLFPLHITITGILLGDDLYAMHMWQLGFEVGRQEFVCEAETARSRHGMEPAEYLQRELWFSSSEARALRRSADDRPPPI
jgi:hypothetical protein